MTDIKNYFLIGDLHTAALVSKDASIDWLCLPHFDSSSVFARLLDPNGGHFALAMPGARMSAGYRGATAIVEFAVQDAGGTFSFTLKDFMVPQPNKDCEGHVLVRKMNGTGGTGSVRLAFSPKPDYARQEPIIERGRYNLKVTLGTQQLVLTLPNAADITQEDDSYIITIPLSDGEQQEVVLQHINNPQAEPYVLPTDKELTTARFWQNWIDTGTFLEHYTQEMQRSMITLKLMQFYPSGALIAAPTTSLPADPGGSRNWDYRYSWIRDATFTVYAFYILDCGEEAVRFFNFVKQRCLDDNFNVHLMYTIDGQHAPREFELTHLAGHQGAQPVRIGNDATQQFQLDVYGTLIDMHYLLYRKKFKGFAADKKFILAMVEKIRANWQRPDSGIWEMRGPERHYAYSKVMAWVGIDRALRMSDVLELTAAQTAELEELRTTIHDWVWDNCFDAERNLFTQHSETNETDAVTFLFVLLQFLDKNDPRTETILKATADELVVNEVFVRRYRADDGLPGTDHAFLLCTFWMISAFAIIGKTADARRLFNTFDDYISASGLLSEQMDEETGAYLGNYPQAFSHLGLVMSAYYIQRYEKKKAD